MTIKTRGQGQTDRPTDRPTDGPTDGPTDRPTDIATYRAAIAAKNQGGCLTPCRDIIYWAKTNTYNGMLRVQGGHDTPCPPFVTPMMISIFLQDTAIVLKIEMF